MTALASNKHPFKCPVCGQTVERKTRQQLYCSTKCRMRASRSLMDAPDIGASDLNAPATILRYEPRQKLNNFNGAKFVKRGWSDGIIGPCRVIEAAVIAGREWEEVVSSDGVKSYVSRLTRRALLDRGASG